LGRAASANCETTDARGLSSEHRKNGQGFPVFRSNHQRIVAGTVAAPIKWREMALIDTARANKKADARPAFSNPAASDSAQADISISRSPGHPNGS
jgi:hypothetical protein